MLTSERKRTQPKEANGTNTLPPLPDEIACHILSLLPTKLAFATTVLSKRWTSLCHSSTSDLRFYYDIGNKSTLHHFLGFVNAVMLFPREQHHPIKNLVLHINSTGIGVNFKVNEWVEVAKRQSIESLDIYTPGRATMSSSILSCRTLVVLKLTSIGEMSNVLSVDLPLLKTLHLSNVTFQKQDDFKKLLYGAPILKDLYVAHINSEIPCTTGSKILPELVKLRFDKFSDPTIAFEITMESHNIYISSPLVFPNLVHIELSIVTFDGWDRVLRLLRRCPRLQHLVIRKAHMKAFSPEKLAYSEHVPECVSSHLRTCFIGSLLKYEDDLRFVAYVLKNAKFLQALTVCPCRLLPNQEPSVLLNEIRSLPRVSPACKISMSDCRFSECSCRFNNTTECKRRHMPNCWKTKGSFLDPSKFYSLNAI